LRILQFHTDSHAYSLRKARRRVRDGLIGAEFSVGIARNMEVAAGEALSNIYAHAYDGRVGPVSVKVSTGTDGLTLIVADDGRATVAPSVPRTLPPHTSHRGRGLYIMGHMVEDVAISLNTSGHGLTVRMTTRLDSRERASAGDG
jgi:anti-sigma regulatory factor (Ser/Thr protein kinase)